MFELIGFKGFIDPNDFLRIAFRITVDLIFIVVIIRFVYLKFHQRLDFAFSCILLNVMTFSVCILLRKVPVELGFALGLFGVFGILRYRTDPISTRDLTYLFVAIGLGMMNAIANKKVSLAELLFIDSAVLAVIALLEYSPISGRRETRFVLYDNLQLLKAENRKDCLTDLRQRTGLRVLSYRIEDIDLLRDAARLTVTYIPNGARDDVRASAFVKRSPRRGPEADLARST